MTKYNRYQKLQKYYLGVPVSPPEYKQGGLITTGEWETIEQCEGSRYIDKGEYICVGDNKYQLLYEEQYIDGSWVETGKTKQGELIEENADECLYVWNIVPDEYMCVKNGSLYDRYQKLQKYNKDGTPVSPPEYKVGEILQQGMTHEECATGKSSVINFNDSTVGDVVIYNKATNRLEIVKNDFPTEYYTTDDYEIAGIIVVPSQHNVYGDNSFAMISAKRMSYTEPDNGKYGELIKFGQRGELVMPNTYDVFNTNGTTINPKFDIDGTNNYVCLASDYNNQIQCPHDNNAYYNPINEFEKSVAPSPYLTDGSRNTGYYQTTSPSSNKNAFADFNGRGNTQVLLNNATAQGDWKTASTITNNSSSGYSPAACCCWRFHTDGTQQGDWYLPAAGELGYLVSRFKKIDDLLDRLLNAYGREYISEFTNYSDFPCASTESSEEEVMTTSLFSTVAEFLPKDTGYNVRAYCRIKPDMTIVRETIIYGWNIKSDDFICEDVNKYQKLIYQVSTNSGKTWENVVPEQTKKGTLIEENSIDCGYQPTRWSDNGKTTCNGTSKYHLLEEEQLIDGTWTATGETKQGDLIEENSFDCGYVETRWVDKGQTTCVNTDKYQVLEEEQTTNGTEWTPTGNTKNGEIIESNSFDCGRIDYRWSDVEGEYMCEGTSKYQKQVYQQTTNGTDWVDVEPKQYQKGSLIEEESYDCGQVNYRWQVIDNETTCVGTDKYYVETYQQTTDGEHWTNVVPEQKRNGTIAESNSFDCGYIAYRWEVLNDETMCDGIDEYYVETYQQSTNGTDWVNVEPLQTRKGELKQAMSFDCVQFNDVVMYNENENKLEIVPDLNHNLAAYPKEVYTPIGIVLSKDIGYGDGSYTVMGYRTLDCYNPDNGLGNTNGIAMLGSIYGSDASLNDYPYYSTGDEALEDLTTGKDKTKRMVDDSTYYPSWKTSSTINNSQVRHHWPAACCSWRFHTVGTEQGDWYLPTAGEVNIVLVNKSQINLMLDFLNQNYSVSAFTLLDSTYGSVTMYSGSNYWYNSTGWYNTINSTSNRWIPFIRIMTDGTIVR